MKTLNQYLLQELIDRPNQQDIVLMMSDLATIGKVLSEKINKAGLLSVLGETGDTNIQGEQVQKLDEIANTLCKNYLRQTGHFAALASEEEEGVVDMGEYGKDAQYVIAFDPLDGSSNIDINVSVGTIFSVHKRLPDIERTDEKQFLQPGASQVIAGYILYGSSTVLVFTTGTGVHEFTLDQGLGEFLLSREHIQVPEACTYYSVNEANLQYMKQEDQDIIAYLRDESGAKARYIGSLVADFHRNLMKGGVFLYPAIDKKGDGNYKGKLRLNYELKPMALLLEQAGGQSWGMEGDILSVQPTSLHQRDAVVMGNKDVITNYQPK